MKKSWMFYTGSVLLVLGTWPIWLAGVIFQMIIIIFVVGMKHGEVFMDWGMDLDESTDDQIIQDLNTQVKHHERTNN